jgi:replicative superfamily II helicase
MAKDFLVEFMPHGARIHKDPLVIEAKMGQDNVALNPNIQAVLNISPAFWKLGVNNTVETCTEKEALEILNSERNKVALYDAVSNLPSSEDRKKMLKDLVNEMSFMDDIQALALLIESAKTQISILQGDSKSLWKRNNLQDMEMSIFSKQLENMTNKISLIFGILAGVVCGIAYILIKAGV